jgi:hypothetical protein
MDDEHQSLVQHMLSLQSEGLNCRQFSELLNASGATSWIGKKFYPELTCSEKTTISALSIRLVALGKVYPKPRLIFALAFCVSAPRDPSYSVPRFYPKNYWAVEQTISVLQIVLVPYHPNSVIQMTAAQILFCVIVLLLLPGED